MVGIIAGFFVVFEHAHGGDFGITYHGRIYNQAYEPLIAPNVEFDLRIYESRTNCLLYREKNSADMAAGDGSFVLTIGKGTRLNIGETQPLEAVFNSKLRLLPNSSCPDGYTKQAGDQLYLLASFTTNSGPQSMSPIVINAAPYSLDTINVAGVASENVLRVIGAPAEPLSADGYQYFLSILNGTAALTSQGLSTKNLTLANSSNSQLMLTAPNGSFASFSLILPDRKGSSGEFLASDNDGALIWTALPPYAPRPPPAQVSLRETALADSQVPSPTLISCQPPEAPASLLLVPLLPVHGMLRRSLSIKVAPAPLLPRRLALILQLQPEVQTVT